ncbi:MAG: HupE/UreJ family protein [Candidatus Binatia bacterium]|nr:HupE/UreJ family protein [Candidatus Binatia bacterium]
MRWFCRLALHVGPLSRLLRLFQRAAGLGFTLAIVGLLRMSPAEAHPLEPTIVELRQLDPRNWEAASWKFSGAAPAALALQLPANCTPGEIRIAPSASFVCDSDALANQTIGVTGDGSLERDVWLRIRFLDGIEVAGSADPETGHFLVIRPDLLPLVSVLRTYFARGVEHVVTGADHLLFLLGLVWLCSGLRQLVATVTMFTLGHTVALVLAAGQWWHLQQSAVEVLIGGSIVLVARELWRHRLASSASAAWYFGFPFGLLHGAGFASALEDLGVKLLPAIAAFNIGVECGQLLWVASLTVVVLLIRQRPRMHVFAARSTAAAVGLAGAWITLERVLFLLSPPVDWP